MLCDERYRARAMRHEPVADAPPPEGRRARLVRVMSCPARPGYRELHFDAAGTPWSWCFPGTAQASDSGRPVRWLIFQPGPHGLTAQAVTDEAGGPTQYDLASAADLAISGVPVFIRGFVARQETARPHPGASQGYGNR